jgi:hypothetical protein
MIHKMHQRTTRWSLSHRPGLARSITCSFIRIALSRPVLSVWKIAWYRITTIATDSTCGKNSTTLYSDEPRTPWMPALPPRPPTLSRNARNRASVMVTSGRVRSRNTLCSNAVMNSSSPSSRL